jgi:hypothetical protein
MRPSIIISLQTPGTKGCNWPTCQHNTTCKGNRLEWVTAEGHACDGDSNRRAKLRLVAPHHKTRPNSKDQQISFILPDDMQTLVQFHITTGLATIKQSLGIADDDPEAPCTVFVWGSTGNPVSPQQVSQLWKRKVLPAGFGFGAQLGRAAFCTLVRDDAAANGFGGLVDEDGAAAIMGNSITMWDTVYDREFRQRRAQAVAYNIATFRQGVLSNSANATAGAGAGVAGGDVATVVVAAAAAAGGVAGGGGHASGAAQAHVITDLIDLASESETESETNSEPEWSDSEAETEPPSDWSASDSSNDADDDHALSESDDEFLECMSE